MNRLFLRDLRPVRFLLVVLLTQIMIIHPAMSQVVQWIGIDNRIGNLMAHRQNNSEWCWAASTQMILNYYGVPVTQESIVQRIHGNQDDQAGTDDDITSALDGWVPVGGIRKIIQAQMGDGLPAIDDLIRELSNGHPILIAFSTGPSSGHAVVITAAGIAQTYAGRRTVRALVIRDPWPSPDHVSTAGRVEYDDLNLYSFSQTVRKHWIISVSLAPLAADVQREDDERTPGALRPKPTNPSSSGDVPFGAYIRLAERRNLNSLRSGPKNDDDRWSVSRVPRPFSTSDCFAYMDDDDLALNCSKDMPSEEEGKKWVEENVEPLEAGGATEKWRKSLRRGAYAVDLISSGGSEVNFLFTPLTDGISNVSITITDKPQ